MKKETEVLLAATEGNITKLECLFEQRQSKVFAGLFKGPNINWRNANGCTALHLAALNGHAEAVIFLLHNDASANTPDNAGSYPLHLAAFNGHAPVARILLERGPSKAQVNEQNMTGDTALHVAAQYNHHIVMDVLLKHHADILLRNAKDETALDLASQYGRFTAVQMLLFKNLNILKHTTHQHSPLHLAARNGHLKVVQLLVDSGMSINSCCEMGTALHTSAMFGKVEVAKYLLKRGINIELKNENGEKVLDVLCKIPSQLSQQITALIYEHSGLATADEKQSERPKTVIGTSSIKSNKLPNYDYVPGFPRKNIIEDKEGIHPYSVVQNLGNTGNRLSAVSGEFDLASLSGKDGDKSQYSFVPGNFLKEKNESDTDDSMQGEYVKVDPTHIRSSIAFSETYDYPPNSGSPSEIYDVPPNPSSPSEIYDVPPNSGSLSEIYDVPPNSISQKIASKPINDDFDNDILNNNQKQAMLLQAAHNLLGFKPLSQSVPMNMHNFHKNTVEIETAIETYDNVTIKNTLVDHNPILDNYDNVNLCPTVPKPDDDVHSGYDNVNLVHGQVQSSYDNVNLKNIPAVDKNQVQTDKKVVKIKQKRTTNKKQKSMDDSLSSSHSSKVAPKEQKETKIKQTRTSVRNVQDGYRMSEIGNQSVLNESYEWNKIDKFVLELEEYAEESEKSNIEIKHDVASWLQSLGLKQYEPIFLSNGFDDINFLNGVITNEDLIELGIIDSEHREKMMKACQNLPKSPVIGEEGFPNPRDIKEWLAKLKLLDYRRRFKYYGYDNMERVKVIWELELVSVLQVTLIGHYKRMLTSLGKQKRKINKAMGSLSSPKIENKEIDFKKSSSEDYVDDSMDVAKQLLETAENLKIERLNRSLSTGNKTENTSSDSELDKTDSSSISESDKSEWIHSSEILLTSAVSYIMEYLGSHPVQEVKGITSTHNACAKMKMFSKNIHKMPSVTLSISVRGIDYIDSNSKMIIGQYAINNISYCAQDPENLNVFAYITRDEITRKHYCHVLRVATIEQADEIIITIGQCFELAYQLYLQNLEKIKSQNEEGKPKVPPRTYSLSQPKARKPPPQPKPFTGKVSL